MLTYFVFKFIFVIWLLIQSIYLLKLIANLQLETLIQVPFLEHMTILYILK